MQQMTFFDDIQHSKFVNVASVPQRSPFRYPGGKTWIVPRLRRWLSPQIRQQFGLTPVRPTRLIEPFAGGSIVSLTAAAEGLTEYVTMVEIDEDVAAVWKTILDGENWQWITREIETFDLTQENVKAIFARTNLTLREQAFRTILRNRVNRGGILAPGAGLVNKGENGKGIRSRWYPATLKKRIQNIVKIRDYITFIYGDGMNVLREHTNRTDVVFFIDPPYTAGGKNAGSRLYTHSELDHEELFEIASRLRSDFIMTYDNVDAVRVLAQRFGFDMQIVPMKNTHHTKMTELLIGPNLEWLRQPLEYCP
jgi:DNA adenine methylase